MAKNDTEVEIKIQVSSSKFTSIQKRLRRIGKFKKKVHQHDEYFSPKHRDFFKLKFPIEYLRIRHMGNKAILNYKYWHVDENNETTHCDEYETQVSDYSKLVKIFKPLGVEKRIVVDKDREVYEINGKFEVSLDIVKSLGKFIEIESINSDDTPRKIRKELFEHARSLGLNPDVRDKHGYVVLLIEKTDKKKS